MSPERRRGLASVVGCTVVTRDRLPAARVLARSYSEHHPDHDFVVLVADEVRPSATDVVGYDWLTVDVERYLELAACRTADELCAAVLPLLVRQLLDRSDAVVALSPRSRVYAPFPEVAGAAIAGGLVLAPRVLTPVERRDSAGGFDTGFLAVGRAAKGFVDFWVERVRDGDDTHDWLTEAPALFRHDVLRDPAFAVGHWNAHERTSVLDSVRLVHFDGYDPDRPWLFNADDASPPGVLLSAEPRLRALCDAYRAELPATAGPAEPYGFGELADGTVISAPMRGVFREASRNGESPPHPFGAAGDTAFRDWLRAPGSPAEAGCGHNRLTMWLWRSRVDLQSAFPRPISENADGYRQWCHTHGITNGPLPEWALPGTPPPVAPPDDAFGVNLAGYLTAELGLGEMGRIVHSVLRAADLPVVSVVEDHSVARSVGTGLAAPDSVGRPRFPVSVVAVNADHTDLVLANHPEVAHRRYRIGLWAWELEDFPAAQRTAFGLVDEVWTVSEFARRSIAAHATVPVRVFPVPLTDPGEPSARPNGLSTRFLFAFDFNSTGGRKNPWGLVTAFRRAFPGRDDVELVIRANNAHRNTAAAERLRYLIGDDRRIDVRERFLSAAELDDLYASSTAYVSLHRSEGFGLTVAEAMVRGLPVICTDYSSTTEFVPDGVGWRIPYTMTDVGPGWPPYPPESRWADPDLAATVSALRAVADDPAEAARRGAAGRAHILATRSMATATDWVRERVTAAYQSWRADNVPPPPASTVRRVVRRAIRRS
jgi:glycosyltransferase involved in cell wall biosynthesis